MRIPNDIVQQVIDLDIVEVVQEYISINKKGSAYTACCPFHNEKTPSFNVSPAKGIYKCFGCGKGGGNIEFVMEHEGLNYREALEELCAKFNIEIPKEEQTAEEIQAEKNRESIFAAMNAAQKLYTPTIEFDSILQKFLSKRQISQETAQKFGIGYCKEQLSLNTIGWNSKILAECGLEYNGKPVFADRITFPIHNHNGQLVAFTARTLSDDKTVAKYINTKAYQLYNKSEILYNLNRSKQEIRKNNHAILLEGQMDVIALDQAGIQNTVASSGTAFTEAQAQTLRRFTKNITVIFDGDKAGIAALEKSLPILLKYGFDIYTLVLPNGQDPDEYIKTHSAEEFIQYKFDHSWGFIEHLFLLYADDYQRSIIGQREVANKILFLISQVSDFIEKHLYLKKFVELTGIPFAALQPEIKGLIIPRQSPKKQA
jgi:DNA primase